MSDDWSPVLTATLDHLSVGTLDARGAAAVGWMAGEVTPLVTLAHEHDAPDAVEAAVDLVLLASLPASMAALAPLLRLALLSGAKSLWHSLTAARIVEAETVLLRSVP